MLLLVAMTTHCSEPSNPIVATETNLPPTSTPLSNATKISLPTAISPTLSVPETSTSTGVSRLSRLTSDCIDISDNPLSKQVKVNGALVLSEFDKPAYFLYLETGIKTLLTDVIKITVSPDRDKLAYEIDGELIILDNHGNEIKRIPDPNNQLSLAQWIDNERLVISYRNLKAGESFALCTIIVLNPFTGEKQEIFPEYPDINDFFPPAFHWEGYYRSRIVPNPALTQIIYPAISGNLILWDMVASHEIQHIYGIDYFNTPWWSPDGKRFVTSAPVKFTDSEGKAHINIDDGLPYIGGDELVTVNQAGEIKRVTFLTTEYEADEFHYSWSPDGQKIAFWLQLDKNTNPQLAVANVNTGEVTNYCISSTYSGARIIWSQDGNQLALSLIKDNYPSTLIVDLQIHAAIKVADKASVLGWVK